MVTISSRQHPRFTLHMEMTLHATIGVLVRCLYLYPTLKTFDANESVMQLISIVGYQHRDGLPTDRIPASLHRQPMDTKLFG